MTNRLRTELTCREIVELITSYLDGALTIEERTRFEQHLSYCRGCATYLKQMRAQLCVSSRLAEHHLDGPARDALLQAFRRFHRGDEK